MSNNSGSKGIRLRVALPLFITLFLALTGISIFVVNFLISMQSTRKIAGDYMEQTGTVVLEKTLNYLDPAARAAAFNAQILSTSLDQQDFTDVFNDVTIPQFDAYKQFALIYFGRESGEFWLNGVHISGTISTQVIERLGEDEPRYQEAVALQEAVNAESDPQIKERLRSQLDELSSELIATNIYVRNSDGSISVEELEAYSYYPSTRGWFKRSLVATQPVWSGAYNFSDSGRYAVSGKPGVTVASPVLDSQGDFVGAVGVDIVIDQLDRFLTELKTTPNARTFVIDRQGRLIASGDLGEAANQGFHTNISDIGYPTIELALEAYKSDQDLESLDDAPNLTAANLSFLNGEEQFLAYFSPVPAGQGPNWIIGLAVPEDDFIGDYKQDIFTAVLISAGVLLLFILLSILIGHRITTPMKILTREAMLIRDFNLDERDMPNSAFVEIANMSTGMLSMKNGLRSFRKYIPGDVVRYLVSSGQEAHLGGEHRDLTIFFSDIADFTTISETMAPDVLVKHLGQYLGSYSQIIASTGGTVDKYIGDAVMAFWNAPNPLENHATAACRAALECNNRLKELRELWKGEGKPPLFTRIGLHTGDVIVGNMGSTERLNYTVIGDPVNLASRIEGLAKVYGVSILVSEDTTKQAMNTFAFRKIDRVMVKGKTVPVTVYELLDEKHSISPKKQNWAQTFEMGLEAYFAQEWDKAESSFKKAKTLHPRDKATMLFLKRIEYFRTAPPPTGWDGVAKYQTK